MTNVRAPWILFTLLCAVVVLTAACTDGGGQANSSAGDACSGFGFTSFGSTTFADRDGDTFFTDRIPGGAGASCGSQRQGRADELIGYTEIYNSDFRDVGVDFRGLGGASPGRLVDPNNFQSQEINLVPSNFTPPTPPTTPPPSGEENPLFGAEDEVVEGLAEMSTSTRQKDPKRARTWKRSTQRPNASRLMVGREDALTQEGFSASVRIDGYRARVVLDLYYRNDRKEQLEGSFQLRLPSDAAVHYLAFGSTKQSKPALAAPTINATIAASMPEIRERRRETWDKPKEARMVARERAAHAFEETVRQQIDPALAEWTGAGVFSARVFPLLPGRLHRITVAYDVDLMPLRGGAAFRIDLPEKVKDVRVEVDARGGPVDVRPAMKPNDGRYHWVNPKARSILVGVRAPRPALLRGIDAEVGPHFTTRTMPPIPALPAAPRDRAVFLVDTSLSSNPERMNVWLKLLRSVLDQNRPQLREFAVLFFNVDAGWWRGGFQANTPQNTRALIADANRLVLEGATDLGRALRAAAKQPGLFDIFLLSDGAATWGESDMLAMAQRLGTKRPLFAYTTGIAGTQGPALMGLARETGGAVFHVNGDRDVARAATAHRARPWRLVRAEIAGTTDVLIAGRPRNVFPGQLLRLAGRGRPTEGATLKLTLAQDGRERQVTTRLGTALDSPLAARAYGELAVGQLEWLGGEARTSATAFANHYRVVGESSSLLMLESEADYERHGITPKDDAALVRSTNVDKTVSEVLAREEAANRGDPKRRFLQRMKRLRELEFMAWSFPKGFDEAVATMPAESFDVAPPARMAKVRERGQVPKDLIAALTSREITYAGLRTEAERRRKAHGAWDALKALSSLVEKQPGDLDLARDLGLTAMAWGLDDQGYGLLDRVAKRRPYQLPTYLALARCASSMDRSDLALVYYETALASGLHERYGGFGEIAALEYARFLEGIVAGRTASSTPDYARRRADELTAKRKVTEADILIVLTWNTDRTDVDLHVTTPSGEHCYFRTPKTKGGGRLTSDVTAGFGPEMFVLPKSEAGAYKIEVDYYGSDATRTAAPSRVLVQIYEDFGRPTERLIEKTLELGAAKSKPTVAIIRR